MIENQGFENFEKTKYFKISKMYFTKYFKEKCTSKNLSRIHSETKQNNISKSFVSVLTYFYHMGVCQQCGGTKWAPLEIYEN